MGTVIGGIVVGLIVAVAGVFLWRRGPEVFAGQREQIRGTPYRVSRFDVWFCRAVGGAIVVAGVVTVVGAALGKLPADGMKH